MGRLWRTFDRRLVRDVAAICIAVGFVGVSYGAIAVGYGVPAWAVIAMSVFVFAGGAQFMAAGMLAAGNPLAAVLGGLLLNARHFPFGLAVGDILGGPRWRRVLGSHVMVDEAVAFAMAQNHDGVRRRHAYWLTGVGIFLLWNTGTVLGVLLGGAVGDPAVLGLDAAFPAGLIALILPSLRAADARRVALVGATVAVLVTPWLPAGLPVLCALLGLVAAGRAPAGAKPAAPEIEEVVR
jgi:4-azaleucine resistance transporter AzlC